MLHINYSATTHVPGSNTPPQLQSLPEEILHSIFDHLDAPSLSELSLVSQWANDHAASRIWADVELIDCRRSYPKGSSVFQAAAADPGGLPDKIFDENPSEYLDEHDDTPIIRKLIILARNPRIASKVRKLTHRCHVPVPNVFTELPHIILSGRTLSTDPRTHVLLKAAVANMRNVHTLRIIFGHWLLSIGLLHNFLHPSRMPETPLRRLWLEGCSLEGLSPEMVMSSSQLTQLKSLRFRRLRLTLDPLAEGNFAYGRGASKKQLTNGAGSYYRTYVNYNRMEAFGDNSKWSHLPADLFVPVSRFDNAIYERLPDIERLLSDLPGYSPYADPVGEYFQNTSWMRQSRRPANFAQSLCMQALESLTSLNLDWVGWIRSDGHVGSQDAVAQMQHDFLSNIASLHFPHLRSFQLRNAISTRATTKLQTEVYLFAPQSQTGPVGFLEFMEAHPNLLNLAWPMDKFYPHWKVDKTTKTRISTTVANLGRTLLGLRIDFDTDGFDRGEPLTDESRDVASVEARARRHLFVRDFAAEMTKVRTIKIEGGVPRDEKRETIRALYRCPLEKVVLIGISCPLGNLWGGDGEWLAHQDPFLSDNAGALEEEHTEAILAASKTVPLPPDENFHFVPTYNWLPGPPMLHTIATHHASTINELKFCGYYGSPPLGLKTPLSDAMLSSLKYFDNLEAIVLSVWLPTFFDGDYLDDSIIQSWTDYQNACSTAGSTADPSTSDLPATAAAVSSITSDEDLAQTLVEYLNANIESFTSDPLPTAPAPAAPSQPPAPEPASTIDPDIDMPDAPRNPPDSEVTMSPWLHDLMYPGTDSLLPTLPPILDHYARMDWRAQVTRSYSPRTLAQQVCLMIGPHLSAKAKRRTGGVRVRSSFCLGTLTSDIFDFDIRIGETVVGKGKDGREVWGNGVLSVRAPREEGERTRRREKLEGREWF
ncbi:hypothetical protein LTS18_010214 [Coniosporium uncinatum]|uniref:Uncharacterized protein n=1 Tax=Coniosporium uncinatum TaxID=93489 RepID=A0ACC3DA46_9PEZI|nr:hypothetical protein LTS18_010214 [Coniosporium uncinatum]